VHAVGQVVPLDAGVLGLLSKAHIGLVAHSARDVISLGGSAGRVHKNDTAGADLGSVQSAGEELVVSTVNGVSALESNNVDSTGEGRADLLRGAAVELTDGKVQSLDLTADIVGTTLSGNHENTGVLEGGDSVALEALVNLVGLVARINVENSDLPVAILQKNLLSGLHSLIVGVENNGQSHEQVGSRKTHLIHHVHVGLLIHESGQRREASVDDELNIAQLTIIELHGKIASSGQLLLLSLILDHLLSKLASMRHRLESGAGSCHLETSEVCPAASDQGNAAVHLGRGGGRGKLGLQSDRN
jgi:hypothetical protein